MQNILDRGRTFGLYLMGLMAALVVSMVLSPAAFAQAAGLGAVAQEKANAAVGDAILVAGIIIGFAVLYKIIRKVTGS